MSGVDRVFDYAVPPALAHACRLGALVRVPLGARRVRGWVVGEPSAPAPGVALREVAAVLAPGPSAEVLDLARAAARRYAGRLRPFLLAATADRLGDAAPAPAGRGIGELAPGTGAGVEAVRAALRASPALVRLPPAAARLAIVTELCRASAGRGDLLVLVPERRDVEILATRLARLGVEVARYPVEWGRAAAGGRVVVGTRSAAFATLARLAGVLVLDAEAPAYVEERAPTWSAVEMARRRADAAGVFFVATSAAPSAALLASLECVSVPAVVERAGWPTLEVVDRRGADPRTGRYAERLATAIRQAAGGAHPVVCVLNRTGRARRLACGTCGELARCVACGAAVGEARTAAGRMLVCPVCGQSRPVVCAACGAAGLKVLRVGAERAAEELAALSGLEVATVAAGDRCALPDAAVLVGTEAVLHRVGRAALVVFLDIDVDLAAARLSAGERTLALLARAGRLVGARPAGRVIVQTRSPDHEVLRAARAGDPTLFSEPELERRRALGLPPWRAVAALSGPGAHDLAASVRDAGIEVVEPEPGRVLLRAPTADLLASALWEARSTEADVRVALDPPEW